MGGMYEGVRTWSCARGTTACGGGRYHQVKVVPIVDLEEEAGREREVDVVDADGEIDLAREQGAVVTETGHVAEKDHDIDSKLLLFFARGVGRSQRSHVL